MSLPGSPTLHWYGHDIPVFPTMFQSSALGAIVSALVVHAVVRRIPPRSARSMVAMLLLPPALLTLRSRPTVLGVLASFGGLILVYLASLGLSVVAYRVSPFHPLAGYPGPFAARVTRWWAFWKASQGVQHWYSHQLFQQYGDAVRTGPNHLIIRDATAVPIVLGSREGWHKGDRYDTPKPPGATGSLVLITDPAEHARRRKLWDRAFTPTALRAYEPMIIERAAQLCRILGSHNGMPFDLTDLISRATFDMMGDFAYGGAFELMADGDTSDIMNIVHQGSAAVESWGTVPWVRPLLQLIPKNKMKMFYGTAFGVAERRRAAGSKIRDLFHYLTDEDGEDGRPQFSPPTLAMEAGLALIAGSETVSSTLLNAIFYLVASPMAMQKLRAELDAAAGLGAAEIEPAVLAQLPYLQAVLNETNRLQPALSNGTQRTPPPGSGPVVVAGHVVPPGTTVQIPTWSLHRDERYFFPDPEVFWPERWTPEGKASAKARGCEFRLESNAYIPWSYGPGVCVGRALAQVELRVLLAALVQHFDICFADGFSQQEWLDGLKDRFALVTEGRLLVVMTRRFISSA